jgi:hypothetical protein
MINMVLKANDNLIEQLSEQVHNAWLDEKKKQGFHAPLDCPNYVYDERHGVEVNKFSKHCSKCHTDMYHYRELPENIKDYDRVTVKSVLKALNDLGYGLI